MTTTVGRRRKRQKSIPVLSQLGFNGENPGENSDSDNEGDELTCDSRGLTTAIRRALLIINPLIDEKGKRKSKSNLERGARPPVLTLAESSRVRLQDKLAFYSGLVPGATGTVVAFAYSSDVTFGPILPGADMNAAIASSEQPQLPIVLVQFDAKYYTGESCHPSLPRVVPIYAKSPPSNTTAKSMCASSYLWSEQTPLPSIKPKEPAPRSTSCALRERHMPTLNGLFFTSPSAAARRLLDSTSYFSKRPLKFSQSTEVWSPK